MLLENQRVTIDGASYQILPLDALEAFAFRNCAEVTYPTTKGWATTRIGGNRWAAEYPSQRTGMPRGSL